MDNNDHNDADTITIVKPPRAGDVHSVLPPADQLNVIQHVSNAEQQEVFQLPNTVDQPTVFQNVLEGNTAQCSSQATNMGDESLSTADLEQINAFHSFVDRSTPEVPDKNRESSVTAQSPHARSTPSSPTTTGLAHSLQRGVRRRILSLTRWPTHPTSLTQIVRSQHLKSSPTKALRPQWWRGTRRLSRNYHCGGSIQNKQAIDASNEEDRKRRSMKRWRREKRVQTPGHRLEYEPGSPQPRPGPMGATGKGARIKKQPERFGRNNPLSSPLASEAKTTTSNWRQTP